MRSSVSKRAEIAKTTRKTGQMLSLKATHILVGRTNPAIQILKTNRERVRYLVATYFFRSLLEKLEGEVTEIDIADAASLDTSSTWTYLINDQPMGDLTQRLMRGVRNKMLGRFSPRRNA